MDLERDAAVFSILHAQLIALIERRSSAQGEEQHGRYACLGSTEPAGKARSVMIAEDPIWPASGRKLRFIS